jgi:ribulose-phosphate 3-epimerase
MMKTQIIPTILAVSRKKFNEKLDVLLDISDKIQIDFMDGQFVDAKSVKLSDVPNLNNLDNTFEAHLMVENPGKWVKRLKNRGFDKIIFHWSAVADEVEVKKIINEIHKLDMKAFVAINPEIREDEVIPVIDDVDGILIMGVRPGKEKQDLLYKTYYKLENLRAMNRKVVLQVDGGVNLVTAPDLVKSGANILNSGSFIIRSKDPEGAYEGLLDVVGG